MGNSGIKSLYAAFDIYPSYKGAATHIEAFTEVLFRNFNPGMLFALGHNPSPQTQKNHLLWHFNKPIKNYLQRAMAFANYFYEVIEDLDGLEICHYRDIWSGLAMINSNLRCAKIFEVNGLPSVELQYRYPHITEATIKKISKIEQDCLKLSDSIITPSFTTRDYLHQNGVAYDKIIVIPNGADIQRNQPKPEDINSPYLIYFGALQPWQGVDVLLKAFAQLKDITQLKLLICSSQHNKFSKPYQKLAEKLQINERIVWKHQLEKKLLNQYLQHAFASIAPLKNSERNVKQGCAPLKILESMAANTLVIASDLPPVREIITNNENGILVRPDRPAALARNIRIMLEHPDICRQLAENGQNTIRKSFQWQLQKDKLNDVYQNIYAY